MWVICTADPTNNGRSARHTNEVYDRIYAFLASTVKCLPVNVNLKNDSIANFNNVGIDDFIFTF